MEPSAYSLDVVGPGNPAWLDQVLQGPGSVATAQFSEDPFIKLRKKLAADQKALLDRRRMADDAVLPQIIEDYKQSSARADAIMQRIDVAMGSLNAPPPQMGQPKFNQGENLAGALTAVLTPDLLPQVLTGLGQAATQRNEVEFENTLRAYGLTRDTAKMAISQMMGRLDREYGVMDAARKQQLSLQESRRNDLFALEDDFTKANQQLDMLEVKHGMDMSELRAKLESDYKIKQLEIEADKQKREAAEKDKARQLEENGINNFGAIVSRQFPTGTPISTEQAIYVNGKADAYVDNFYERETPEWFRMREGIGDVMERDVSPSLAWDKEKYQKSEPDRALQGDIDRERLRQMKEKPSPATAQRQKQFADVDKRIKDARAKIEEMEALGPPSGDTEKYERELKAERIRLGKAEDDKARLQGEAPKPRGGFLDKIKGMFGSNANVTPRSDPNASLKPQAGADYQKAYNETKALIQAALQQNRKDIVAEAKRRFKARFGVDFK